MSRPPSPKGEHEVRVQLPQQEDFAVKEEKEEEDGMETPPALERRETFVGDARDTRVAV